MERYCSNCGDSVFEEYYICTACRKSCTLNDDNDSLSMCCGAELEEDNCSECCGSELQSEMPDLDEIAYERHIDFLIDCERDSRLEEK